MNWTTIENTQLWKKLTFDSKKNLQSKWKNLTDEKKQKVIELFLTSEKNNKTLLETSLKDLELKKNEYKQEIKRISKEEYVNVCKKSLTKLLNNIK